MRILLAVHHFPPRYISGGEWQAHRTAQALQARGHTVQVVCVEHIDQGPAAGLAWTDDVYDGLPVRRLSFRFSQAPEPERWEFDNPLIGDQLRELIEEFQPDLFHLVGGYLISSRALQVAHNRRLPTIVTLLDFWYLCRRLSLLRSDGQLSPLPLDPTACARCIGEEKRRFRWLGQALPPLARAYWASQPARRELFAERLRFNLSSLALADRVISPSQFLRTVYSQAGLAPEKIVCMRFGLDLSRHQVELKRPAPEALRVVYLGQITEIKGVHTLIEAARRLKTPRLRVQIYGDPARFPKYHRRLLQLSAGDPRIALMGAYHGPTELGHILSDSDVLVVPSVWYENSPTVIPEAFLHRTPVIVSDLGGMPELVEDGVDGLRFQPGSAADLARCLQRLLDEPGLLERLRAGIKPVKAVGQEMDELEALYQQVVQARAA